MENTAVLNRRITVIKEDMAMMRTLNKEKRFYNMSLEQLEKFLSFVKGNYLPEEQVTNEYR